jgi:hypothetical protein
MSHASSLVSNGFRHPAKYEQEDDQVVAHAEIDLIRYQCVATGAPDITSLAKVWNGKTWRVIRTINP